MVDERRLACATRPRHPSVTILCSTDRTTFVSVKISTAEFGFNEAVSGSHRFMLVRQAQVGHVAENLVAHFLGGYIEGRRNQSGLHATAVDSVPARFTSRCECSISRRARYKLS